MELKELQTELSRLQSLVDGWEAAGHIPAIERETALRRLSDLYDLLRFAEGGVRTSDRPDAPVDRAASEAEALRELEPEQIVAEEPVEPTASPLPEPTPPTVDTPEAPAPLPENAHASEPAAAPGEQEVAEPFEADPAPMVPIDLEAVLSESHDDAQAQQQPTVSEVAEPIEIPTERTDLEPLSDAEGTEPAPKPIAADSLFDLDELVVRRRRTRRMILSLYGDEEAPEVRQPGKEDEPPHTEKSDSDVSYNELPPVAEADAQSPVVTVAAAPSDPSPVEEATATEHTDTKSPARAEEPETDEPAHANATQEDLPPQQERAPIEEASCDTDDRQPETVEPTNGEAPAPVTDQPGSTLQPAAAVSPRQPEHSAQTESEPAESAVRQRENIKPAQPEAQTAADRPKSTESRTQSVHILGEVLQPRMRTLGDEIHPAPNLASKLVRDERIVELRSAVGINDRFLMIRDLFDGDSEQYEKVMQQLDTFAELDDCMIYIAENFQWDPDCDGARLLVDLLERKLQ